MDWNRRPAGDPGRGSTGTPALSSVSDKLLSGESYCRMKKPALSDLISLGEGFTTEFKRSLPSDLGREICAFANATGGVILVGVDDAGTVVGVANHNRLKSQVQSLARSADPPVAVEMESEGEVLLVTVPEQHSKPYAFGGRFFIREGASCQQLSRDEIRDFFFKEGLIRPDETPCNTFDPSVEITPVRSGRLHLNWS